VIILGALFVVGLFYAVREGSRETGKSLGQARGQARKAAAAQGGRYGTPAVMRRAQRQAAIGWLAGETRHGFPVTRHGFSTGWNRHQHAMAERERDHLGQLADLADNRRRLAAEISAHRQRLAEQAEVAARASSQKTDPPLADGKTAGNGPSQKGHDPMACKDPSCTCHTKRAAGADPGTAGSPSTNGAPAVSGDLNYTEAVSKAAALLAAADNGVNDELVGEATKLADQLGAMVPDDSTTQGMAADVATAAADVIEAHKRLADHSAALQERLEATYGPTNEAVQSSGESAAQPEFHNE
jgi:hypothetical protein